MGDVDYLALFRDKYGLLILLWAGDTRLWLSRRALQAISPHKGITVLAAEAFSLLIDDDYATAAELHISHTVYVAARRAGLAGAQQYFYESRAKWNAIFASRWIRSAHYADFWWVIIIRRTLFIAEYFRSMSVYFTARCMSMPRLPRTAFRRLLR